MSDMSSNECKKIKELCKAISACVGRGEITKQQGKTLMGQAKREDYAGAMRGLGRIYDRG